MAPVGEDVRSLDTRFTVCVCFLGQRCTLRTRTKITWRSPSAPHFHTSPRSTHGPQIFTRIHTHFTHLIIGSMTILEQSGVVHPSTPLSKFTRFSHFHTLF